MAALRKLEEKRTLISIDIHDVVIALFDIHFGSNTG